MRRISANTSKIRSIILAAKTEGQSLSIRDVAYQWALLNGYSEEELNPADPQMGLPSFHFKRIMSNARSTMRTLTDSQPNPIYTVNINGVPHYYANSDYGRKG